MDYEKFQSFGHMSLSPDILIVPSEMRYFIKVQSSELQLPPHKHLLLQSEDVHSFSIHVRRM